MKLIDDFEQAVRRHEMKGAQHPQQHDLIEQNYKATKQALTNYIKALRSERQTAIDNESRLRYPDRTGQ